jgi:drug/metabolite transporter (DMT)-like permease
MSKNFSLDFKHIVGVGMVMLGAIGFGSKAVIVKLMYRYGVDTISTLTLRMLFSIPFFFLVIVYNYKKVPLSAFSKKDKLLIPIMGFVGYYGSSLFDFLGLQYISAGLERLILFIYPTIVVMLTAILFKKKINKTQVYALIMTYMGIALALFTDFSFGGSNFVLGASLIFTSAITYSVYLIGSGRIIPRIGSILYTSYVMLVATICVLIHYLITNRNGLWDFPKEVYELNIWMAIVATVVPAFLTAEGIRLIGSDNMAIVGTVGPISTILMANLFLGEAIEFWQVIGTLFVLAGVLLIGLQKKEKAIPEVKVLDITESQEDLV